MNNKKDKESYPVGTPRNIIIHYLKETENEWNCKEIPSNKNNKYIRKIIFTRDEKWKNYE